MSVMRHPSIWFRLALLLVLVPLLGISPRDHRVEAALQRARIASARGEFDAASRALAAAANLSPQRPDLWEGAGLYAFDNGDPQSAVDYLERARLASSSGKGLSARGWLVLGDSYQQLGSLEKAIPAWQLSLGSGGDSSQLYPRLVAAYIERNESSKAYAILEKPAVQRPENARLYFDLALLSLAQEPDKTLPLLETATRLDASFNPAYQAVRRSLISARQGENAAYTFLAAGRSLASLERWDLAVEAFRKAVAARPDYAEAWAYLGEALQHTSAGADLSKQAGTGWAELNQALTLAPESLSARLFTSLYWARRQDYPQALAALQAAIELEPQNPVLYSELGNLLASSGDLLAAYQSFQHAIQLAPKDAAELRQLVAFCLTYDFEVQEVGLPAARQAIVLDPDEPANQDAMAQVLIKLEDELNAERFLLRAIQLDPAYAPARLHLGALYLLRGEKAAAAAELSLARSLAPGTSIAIQAERLLERTLQTSAP